MVSDLTSDLDSLLSNFDLLGQVKDIPGIHEALRIARQAILAIHELTERVQDNAAYNIGRIWNYIEDRKLAEPQHITLIDQWSHSLKEEITPEKFNQYCSLTAKTRAGQHDLITSLLSYLQDTNQIESMDPYTTLQKNVREELLSTRPPPLPAASAPPYGYLLQISVPAASASAVGAVGA
ncbi:MAG: hypothetical protein Q9226_008202 [Calogaya cf. arnoldii]